MDQKNFDDQVLNYKEELSKAKLIDFFVIF